MPLVNVVLNQAAVPLLKDRTQVRIRIKDGQLQFLPTDRVSEINLPKGERLRPIVRSNRSAYFTVKEDFLEIDQIALIEGGKYGWFTLRSSEVEQKGLPFAKFVAAASQVGKRQTKPSKSLIERDKQVSLL